MYVTAVNWYLIQNPICCISLWAKPDTTIHVYFEIANGPNPLCILIPNHSQSFGKYIFVVLSKMDAELRERH